MFTCAAISETPLIQKNALLDPNFGLWSRGREHPGQVNIQDKQPHVFTCLWTLGGNLSTGREPRQIRGEHANSTQKSLWLTGRVVPAIGSISLLSDGLILYERVSS